LDVVYSVASVAKRDISGDTHSFLKLSDNRFLFSLCDGMGSGQAAQKIASGASSLIESFYRAGFDHQLAIGSANRFLSLAGGENFSACDICVLDLNDGGLDMFKISTPASFIKGEESVKVIEGSSLPLGAADVVRPSAAKNVLRAGQMVVLVSDGISECFSTEGLAAQISHASEVSPKLLCEQILSAALQKTKVKRDDMTVLAVRVFDTV
ncbi:MAG: SpoIIE family protein phosphatase, partial [Firmicutes bacterium]|nr:SpoIIE family protein phosphatase [Bacillota bacterium]